MFDGQGALERKQAAGNGFVAYLERLPRRAEFEADGGQRLKHTVVQVSRDTEPLFTEPKFLKLQSHVHLVE